jgi:hypothetical protein
MADDQDSAFLFRRYYAYQWQDSLIRSLNPTKREMDLRPDEHSVSKMKYPDPRLAVVSYTQLGGLPSFLLGGRIHWALKRLGLNVSRSEPQEYLVSEEMISQLAVMRNITPRSDDATMADRLEHAARSIQTVNFDRRSALRLDHIPASSAFVSFMLGLRLRHKMRQTPFTQSPTSVKASGGLPGAIEKMKLDSRPVHQ